jgi:hypothetical protein
MKKQLGLLFFSTIVILVISSCGEKKEKNIQSSATESQVENISCEYCGKSVPKASAIFDDVRYNYFCSDNCFKSWLFQNSIENSN